MCVCPLAAEAPAKVAFAAAGLAVKYCRGQRYIGGSVGSGALRYQAFRTHQASYTSPACKFHWTSDVASSARIVLSCFNNALIWCPRRQASIWTSQPVWCRPARHSLVASALASQWPRPGPPTHSPTQSVAPCGRDKEGNGSFVSDIVVDICLFPPRSWPPLPDDPSCGRGIAAAASS